MLLHTLQASWQQAFCMGPLQASVVVSQLDQGSRLNTQSQASLVNVRTVW